MAHHCPWARRRLGRGLSGQGPPPTLRGCHGPGPPSLLQGPLCPRGSRDPSLLHEMSAAEGQRRRVGGAGRPGRGPRRGDTWGREGLGGTRELRELNHGRALPVGFRFSWARRARGGRLRCHISDSHPGWKEAWPVFAEMKVLTGRRRWEREGGGGEGGQGRKEAEGTPEKDGGGRGMSECRGACGDGGTFRTGFKGAESPLPQTRVTETETVTGSLWRLSR